MAKQRKEGTLLNIKLAQDIYDKMLVFCEKEERTKTYAVEKALTAFLDEYFADEEKQK